MQNDDECCEVIKRKHTPGPWFTDSLMQDDPLDIVVATDGNVPSIIAMASDVCVSGGLPESNTEALRNARLIAAAPEMLDFIEMCANTIVANHEPQHFGEMLRGISDEADTLFRKINQEREGE